MQAQVQPYAGTSTFVPLFDSGELDFGVVNAVDMGMVYRGANFKVGGRNPFPHVASSRLIMRGSPLRSSFIVRKDSPIKTFADVKGKRATGEYPAQLAVWYNMFGSLSNAGLTWNDVKVVPVPAVNEGVDALIQGRADVTTHAIGSAKVERSRCRRRHSLPISRLLQARRRADQESDPGYYLSTVKAGSSTGILEDICAYTYDIYLVGQQTARRRRAQRVAGDLGQHRKVAAVPPRLCRVDQGPRRRSRSDDSLPSRRGSLFQRRRSLVGKNGRRAEKTIGVESVRT